MADSLQIPASATLANEHFDQFVDGGKGAASVAAMDLSYWAGLGESYQPECWPLAPRPLPVD